MKILTILSCCLIFSASLSFAVGNGDAMKKGSIELSSISALEFSPDGILFIGDSQSGSVYAVDLEDNTFNSPEKPPNVENLELMVSALLGAKPSDVLIHDMAVHPKSKDIYLSVSRGRANWNSKWQLPNDLDNASILLKISPEGEIEEVTLTDVKFSSANLPNPIGTEGEHRWKKGIKLRIDAITTMAYKNDKLYVAGLSNEEFSSSMWVFSYPFDKKVSATTMEIYHGAHGKYETHAPIRAFLPYDLGNEEYLLAAYLCTPLVTIPTSQLKDKAHIKGRTVAEFGSGNYPLDMVAYKSNGKDYILMSNSQLPLMIIDPNDIESYEGSITEEVEGYMSGVSYQPRSGSGIQQLDSYDVNYIVGTQRMPSGTLSLISYPKDYLTK